MWKQLSTPLTDASPATSADAINARLRPYSLANVCVPGQHPGLETLQPRSENSTSIPDLFGTNESIMIHQEPHL